MLKVLKKLKMLKKSFYQPFKLFFLFTIFINFSCNNAADSTELKTELKEASRDYCQRYGEELALKYLKLNKAKVVIQSVGPGSILEVALLKLGNVVTPSKSRLADVFRCKFEIHADNNDLTNISVDILIFKTKKEAQYHADGGWKNIQLISVEEYSSKDKKNYYMIVKYLKINGRQVSASDSFN